STSTRPRPTASRYRANSATGIRTAPPPPPVRRTGSGLEGVPAAAAALGVGIVDREAGAVQAVDVVDLRAAHVLHAVGVDVDLDAAGLDHLVAFLRRVLPPELVREARAAAPDHAEPQPPLGLALLQAERFDLLGGGFRQRDHSGPPLSVRRARVTRNRGYRTAL